MAKDEASALRIAHILPFSGVGGTEIATLRLSRAAAGHGYQSVAFHLAEAPGVGRFFAGEGLETATFGGIQPSIRHPGAYLAESRSLASEFRKRRISAVHCADWLGAYFTSLAVRLSGLPLITHIRNRYDSIHWRDRCFLLPVDRFVFVSRSTWKQFGHRVPPDKGTVLYDGVAVQEEPGMPGSCRASVLSEWGLPADTFLVGMVARISPQKDLSTLVEAARRIVPRHPKVRFLIAGDYAGSSGNQRYYDSICRQIKAAGLESYFVFTGFREDVPRLIHALDLFVLCTHWEGFPLVILEAMGCCKPVIATAVDGIPEIVIPEQTGLLHKPAHSEDLALQMLRLIENRDLLRQLAQGGRHMVATQFSAAKFSANVAALYGALRRTP